MADDRHLENRHIANRHTSVKYQQFDEICTLKYFLQIMITTVTKIRFFKIQDSGRMPY